MVDEAVARRTPWYAKPQAYAAGVFTAAALAVVCPLLPPQAQPACAVLDQGVHRVLPFLGPGPAQQQQRDQAAAELRDITTPELPPCSPDGGLRHAVRFTGSQSCRCDDDGAWRDVLDGGACP